MSYINSLKCDEFRKNPKEHFSKTKVVYFSMIHAQARGDKLDQKMVNDSRTILENHLDGYKSKEKIVSSAIKCQHFKTLL